MKLMQVPNGENVTYSYIQKTLQTYRDVFDDRLDMMDRKFDDIKAHLASIQVDDYRQNDFKSKHQDFEFTERNEQ